MSLNFNHIYYETLHHSLTHLLAIITCLVRESPFYIQWLMIIKGLFRGYETWNPVHPTTGAFWGMGIGVGCGVGWGPGFGHEVVGYVGAGCGVGFSVGITFTGIGIGLPTNCIIEAPYNAMLCTKNCAWEFARSGGFVSIRNRAGDGWNSVASCLSGLNQEASERFSSFSHKNSLDRVNDLSNLRRAVAFHGKSILESLETHIARVSRPAKD